ncbi:MAG: WbqC family protein [Dysgonamonadaceae bacterium]|jgi:hypothetical protein|nr:WbqC family protein [Dysgonamonadaceae bacterium]
MKLGIMQPYFLPYIGYWQLIKAVDTYVIYDDVAYIVRGWINRNNLLINGEKRRFTINLKNASHNKLINEIEILDDFRNFMKTIEYNYSRAPYYKKVIEILVKIIAFDKSNLALFIANSISIICDYLNIDTHTVLSSSLQKDVSLKGKEKIIAICKLLNADKYYNSAGGIALYKKDDFFHSNIDLYFLKTHIYPYKQFTNTFISDLSIIDVMMFNSVEEINNMLNKFELV